MKLIGSGNDFTREVVSLVRDLLHLYLQFGLHSVFLGDLFLGHSDHVLAQFVSLLEVNDKLVLPSNDLLIFLNLFLEHQDFLELGVTHFVQEIVQGSNFNIKLSDLVIFQQGEFAKLVDLVTSVQLVFSELLHHADEGAHVLGASLFEVAHDLLGHNDFLFMLL